MAWYRQQYKEEKMVIVAFPPGEKYAVNYTTLDQYDYGQILRIQGLKLPKTVEVHFSTQETGGTSITRVGVTKDGVTDVLIPDSVLENGDTTQNYSIFAFVYITDATSGKTEYRARLEVKARPKPEIPGGGDNPDIFHEAVLEVRKSAEKAEEAQKQAEGWAHGREDIPERAEDNAMYYAGKASEDAKKTAQDRAEVERLTESNTQMQGEVAKDLEEVKKFSSQAQTSATNAALSEQKSKEAATRAETAQTGAETAEGNAELAAQKTGQDKTAVEQAKKLVQQIGQEVLDNKNAVDKTVQDFDLTAQQALADVNNAGQTQTERVQSAGTTAVENIKTAQNTATQAVETAKAEAIKTVADKGKEVLEAIPNFDAKLDTKLDKNQGAEHAGKALVVGEDGNVVLGKPQTEGVGDAADAIVNTVSGMLLNIKDSAERKNKGFGMSGKTEQVQTSGKQMLNEELLKSLSNYTSNGLNYYYYRLSGLEVGKKYTISRGDVKTGKNALLGISVNQEDTNKAKFLVYDGLGTSYNNVSITWEQTTGEYVDILFSVSGSVTSTTQERLSEFWGRISYVQLEKGTTATPYEPYTGGKPSPSPEYPQEIVNAGKLNPETQKYEVNIRITNAKESWDKEQTLTLTSDRPLTKWDRLVEQDGQIGWLYATKYIEDLAEIIRDNTPIYGTEQKYFNVLFENEKFDYSMKKVVSETGSYKVNKELYTIDVKENTFLIKINADDTIQTAKEHLHYSVMYNTTQTEFVPLPQSEQNAIRALQTYYPTTVVSNSEDAEMQLSYVADTKNYTDNKIKEAVSAQTQSLANLLSLMPLSTQAAMIETDTNNILDNMEVPK